MAKTVIVALDCHGGLLGTYKDLKRDKKILHRQKFNKFTYDGWDAWVAHGPDGKITLVQSPVI